MEVYLLFFFSIRFIVKRAFLARALSPVSSSLLRITWAGQGKERYCHAPCALPSIASWWPSFVVPRAKACKIDFASWRLFSFPFGEGRGSTPWTGGLITRLHCQLRADGGRYLGGPVVRRVSCCFGTGKRRCVWLQRVMEFGQPSASQLTLLSWLATVHIGRAAH